MLVRLWRDYTTEDGLAAFRTGEDCVFEARGLRGWVLLSTGGESGSFGVSQSDRGGR